MIDTKIAAAAVVAKLQAEPSVWPAGHDVFDGAPKVTPAGAYFCFYDQTGADRVTKYAGVRGAWNFQVSCIAHSLDGVRDAAAVARSALKRWAPVRGATPIVELGQGAIQSGGEDNDWRFTAPLTFRCWLPDKEI